VLEDASEIINAEWSKIIFPISGYLHSDVLSTFESSSDQFSKSKEMSNNDWHAEIIYGPQDYNFIKSSRSEDARNVAVIKNGEPVLIIVDNKLPLQAWYQVIYPTSGFIDYSHVQGNKNKYSFEFGFSFSPVSIPYEKNFKNLNNPIGGYIKFANETWNLGLRLYYTIGTSHLKTYELETHRGGIEITYDFIKLFDDAFSVYGFAGGGYWTSTLQNTKYPNMSYFKAETDSGPMYSAGGGINYTYYGFVLDVHYTWYGAEEGVFGDDPIPGQFMNQYKLFTSSHQLVTMLGYKIEL
jgi:hypothetical protein